MDARHIKAELYEIGKTYPRLLGLMQKQLTPGFTVGQHWAELMRKLDQIHFDDVCHELATLKRPLPDPIDQLPYEITAEVNDRYHREQKHLEAHVEQVRYRLVKSGQLEAANADAKELAAMWRERSK